MKTFQERQPEESKVEQEYLGKNGEDFDFEEVEKHDEFGLGDIAFGDDVPEYIPDNKILLSTVKNVESKVFGSRDGGNPEQYAFIEISFVPIEDNYKHLEVKHQLWMPDFGPNLKSTTKFKNKKVLNKIFNTMDGLGVDSSNLKLRKFKNKKELTHAFEKEIQNVVGRQYNVCYNAVEKSNQSGNSYYYVNYIYSIEYE